MSESVLQINVSSEELDAERYVYTTLMSLCLLVFACMCMQHMPSGMYVQTCPQAHVICFMFVIIRNSTIRHLVHPLCTVLDDSIGCALWFASRGCGLLYPSMQPYQSNARVILA